MIKLIRGFILEFRRARADIRMHHALKVWYGPNHLAVKQWYTLPFEAKNRIINAFVEDMKRAEHEAKEKEARQVS